MRGNWPVFANYARSVFLFEIPAHVSVQRNVKRPNLLPQAVEFSAESVGRHVVIRTPHRAHISKPCFTSALICELHHSRVTLAHRRSDCMPSLPRPLQFLGVATGGHNVFDVIQRKAFPVS